MYQEQSPSGTRPVKYSCLPPLHGHQYKKADSDLLNQGLGLRHSTTGGRQNNHPPKVPTSSPQNLYPPQ